MVGIVIVSHSHRIAEGVAELAREMGGPDVRLETAGGLALPDHPIGTDAVLVMEAVERAWSDDGVLVLMDLGSAVLSAEMALDLMPQERRSNVLLCEAPIVEGAVAAAVTAKLGATLERVAEEARGGLAGKVAHLGDGATVTSVDAPVPDPTGRQVSFTLTVDAPHGLHARPAARFVQTASSFDARVVVRDVTNGRGPADAASLNAVATLGATKGHELEITVTGPQADEAAEAIHALAARSFDDRPDPAGPSVWPASPASPIADAPTAAGEERVLRGHAASPGIAIGTVRHFRTPDLPLPDVASEGTEHELAALDAALDLGRDAIAGQRAAVLARAGAAEAEIFDAHLLLLRDEALLEPARQSIRAEGSSAARAWHDVVERTAAGWDALDDEYLRARAADVRSVGAQVLAGLLGIPMPRPTLDAPGVLVAADLSPADTASLDPDVVLGIVTASGGPTSHAAVLARSMGIPAVVGVGEVLTAVAEGTGIAIDGASGLVYVEPNRTLIGRLGAARQELEVRMRTAKASAHEPARTADGTSIEVSANIGSPDDAAAAVSAGADGVGLFRTEFLFMGRLSMPDELEQEAAYRRAAEALAGRPLTIRTLDVGADKPLPYLAQPPEANPFLGVRGIRLGLERPELLGTQLRAILRVAKDHPVRLMFPMIATFEELRAAKEELDRSGARPSSLEVGIMIEVPSAALLAARLAPEVDFFSIGTNDLTQYTMAADRGNVRVAALADALHPAVLRLIAETVDAAGTHGCWVGVCGELAGDPNATRVLVGLGVRELSMAAPAIATVKQAVRSTDSGEARSIADEALGCATAEEVRASLANGRAG
jgi:phosphoenolpyruvate-protein phosphotransferase/dihydroxyacetone kinase phosphotransfer subunit